MRRRRFILVFALAAVLIVAGGWGVWCRVGKMLPGDGQVALVDSLNDMAAEWMFVAPDSAQACALQAEQAAEGYVSGLCEALNHQMYVCLLKMDFGQCEKLYGRILKSTHNEIELFAAEVGMMWICQRSAQNKAFFDHSDRAMRHLKRITDEGAGEEGRGKSRTERATTFFYLAQAAYHTQLLQENEAQGALAAVDTEGHIRRDKALLSLYWYLNGVMAGQGRMWEDVEQTLAAFDSYLTVYSLATHYGYPYFEVKAELALAEMLSDTWICGIIENNRAAELDYLCHLFSVESTEEAGCNLQLPLEMAETGLEQALGFGSLWLEAEARLVLGGVAFSLEDYVFALEEYGHVIALLNEHHRKYYPNDKELLKTYDDSGGDPAGIVWAKASDTQTVPGLVMAVREQLSLTYSALDDKPASDYNRNAYLDLLDFTRQDRSLESRVHAAERDNRALRVALQAVVVLALMFSVFLILYARKWRKRDMRQHQLLDDMSRWFMEVASRTSGNGAAMAFEIYPWMKKEKRILEDVLRPYLAWAKKNRTLSGESDEECRHIHDEIAKVNLRTEQDKRENIGKRAKVALVHDVTPLIGRILHAVDSLGRAGTATGTLEYVEELADEINRHNDVLTEWIRLNRGELALAVESFPLQSLFDLLARGELMFRRKGVILRIHPTSLLVKADKALTFFMLHTLADNARKFTPAGGLVEVKAEELADAVEVSVTDTGCGLSDEDVEMIRSSKVYDASRIGVHGGSVSQKGHGFGLLNCKGIIEKYRKSGGPFQVCRFHVESRLGEGSRFSFRLPKGVLRMSVWAVLAWGGYGESHADGLQKAASYADSVYFANIDGDYARGIRMADTAFCMINAYYATSLPASCRDEHLTTDGGGEEELKWWAAGVKADYHLIMGLRNEVAIAALALRRWDVYGFNNFQFSHLYKLLTKDSSLEDFYLQQRKARSSLNMGIVLLVLLVSLFALSAYVVYFRRRILFRFNVMQVLEVNRSLLGVAGNGSALGDDKDGLVCRMLSVVLSGLGELHNINGIGLLLRPEREHKGRSVFVGDNVPEMDGLMEQACQAEEVVADPAVNVHAYPLLLRKGTEGGTLCIGAISMDYGDYRMRKEDFIFERYVVTYLSIMLYETVVLRGMEQTDVEAAQEERRRALFEESRLRVQNQILDNCLSFIKHESMYYPSRIKQIVRGMRENRGEAIMAERIGDLREVVTYYEEIYTLLCAQADRQVETSYFKCMVLRPADVFNEWHRHASRMAGRKGCAIDVDGENACTDDVCISADKVLMAYLLETLTKEWLSGCREDGDGLCLRLRLETSGRFVRFSLSASWNAFPSGETDDLFYSGKAHYPYLLCKEAMREQDRLNNFCGCRIEARHTADGGSLVWFTLPRNEGGK